MKNRYGVQVTFKRSHRKITKQLCDRTQSLQLSILNNSVFKNYLTKLKYHPPHSYSYAGQVGGPKFTKDC